ncbi:MAG: hypothetical protein Q4F47_07900 [Bacteroidaceae bacterium]|nr:hypothetical protein [Bacteroidaceae bacterium]
MKLKFFFPFLALMLVSNVFISCSDDNDGGNSDNDDDDSSIVISSTDALMLEDFIWDDMEPSVTRASADEDFPEMKFLAYFQNNAQPQEDRTYDVGVALYNAEKERVCTYQLYDSVYFTYGNPYKMDDKIIISKEINDGVYQLRPICKINGEEEWEDMKMADELSLIITISGNQAQLTKAFNEVEGSMEVKNLYIEQEKVYPNEEFKVSLDIAQNLPYLYSLLNNMLTEDTKNWQAKYGKQILRVKEPSRFLATHLRVLEHINTTYFLRSTMNPLPKLLL